MAVSNLHQGVIAGAAGAGSSYVIEDSIWLDGTADYLTQTFAGSGNRNTYTRSFWIKRNKLGAQQRIFDTGPDGGNNLESLYFGSGDTLYWTINDSNAVRYNYQTTQVFRDTTAWYHFVCARDTATVKMYVNGDEITSFATSTNAGTSDIGRWTHTDQNVIGRYFLSGSDFLDGYIAEVVQIDGQILTASSFGEENSDGVWVPKDPSDLTFGTNGFYLQFKQTGSGQDASGIGADTSGVGRHWAVAGGAPQSNQVTDSCTDDADNDIGNYATWNTISDSTISSSGVATLSDGNLTATSSSGAWRGAESTLNLPSSGKIGFKLTMANEAQDGFNYPYIGIAPQGDTSNAGSVAWVYGFQGYNGNMQGSGVSGTLSGGGLSAEDVVELLIDIDDGTAEIKVNGTSEKTDSGLTFNNSHCLRVELYSYALTADFGQSGYNPSESDHKTLNTANLPAPTIKNPDDGLTFITLENGSTIEASLATKRSGWSSYIEVFKRDDGTLEDYDVRFSDDSGNSMHFNTNAAAGSEATLASGVNYSAWAWRVGAAYGCYTAEISHTNGVTTNQAHGLGSGAKTAVAKISNTTGDWYVSHPNMSSANIRWNVQDRPSTTELVTVDGTNITLNSSFASGTYRVIVWEEIEGFSKFMGYSHNGSTSDGPYIHFGGSPSLAAWRNIDSSNSNDFFATFPTYSTNGNGNPTDIRYNWYAQEKGYDGITIGDVTSNGYKMRPSAGSGFGKDADDPMLVWAWGLRPVGGSGVAQSRAR